MEDAERQHAAERNAERRCQRERRVPDSRPDRAEDDERNARPETVAQVPPNPGTHHERGELGDEKPRPAVELLARPKVDDEVRNAGIEEHLCEQHRPNHGGETDALAAHATDAIHHLRHRSELVARPENGIYIVVS